MTSDQPAAKSQGGWLIATIRRNPWNLVAVIALIVSITTFLVVSFGTAGLSGLRAFAANSFAYLWVMAWMLLATLLVRTLSIRELFAAFAGGFFTASLVVHLIAKPIIAVAGVTPFVTVYAVPILEELAKAIPLLLIVVSYWRRRGEHAGLSDFVVAGFAVGAGYGLHEDLLYGRAVTTSNGLISGVFDGTLGLLFPNFFVGGSTTLVAHAGWGLLVGLGVGVASILWHRIRWFALIPAAAFIVVAIIDHGSWNDRNTPWIASFISQGHQLAIALNAVAIPAAILTDYLMRRRYRSTLPFPTLRAYPYFVRRGGGVVEVLLCLIAYGHYRRGWYSEAYAVACGAEITTVNPRLDAWLVVAFPPNTPRTLKPKTSRTAPDPGVVQS